jgi:TPR repeat protein
LKISIFQEEMASSSSHNNNGIPLATLLEWYKIRDLFFGGNFVSQNIPLALLLATSCAHPDARWLVEACAGKDVKTREEAKEVFSSFPGQEDARLLCFGWLLGDWNDLSPLRRSAELGFAFAQALLSEREEKFKWAHRAAAQDERDGLFCLGRLLLFGDGCEMDVLKAKKNFLRASELGNVWAMDRFGRLLVESDPQRWRWWGRAAAARYAWNFLSDFARQVALFNSGHGNVAVVFAIGNALRGYVDEEGRTIFAHDEEFDSRIHQAKQAIAFYEAQIKATKDAIIAWNLVGIHFKIVKDIRKLIAKLVWDSREEALYKA